MDYAKLAGGDEDRHGSEGTGGGVWRSPAGRDYSGLRKELVRQFETGRSLSCATRPASSAEELLSLDAGQPVKYTAAGGYLFARPGAAQLIPEALVKLLGSDAEVGPGLGPQRAACLAYPQLPTACWCPCRCRPLMRTSRPSGSNGP